MKTVIHSEEEMHVVAKGIAALLAPIDAVLLYGDLGVGKTTLARGIITAINSEIQEVLSPTFTLLQQYHGENCDIWHYDLYRLESAYELEELGIDDAWSQGIVIVEWPEILGKHLPSSFLEIHISMLPQDGSRYIELHGQGHWASLLLANPNIFK